MHLSRQKQEIIQANNTVQFSACMSFFLAICVTFQSRNIVSDSVPTRFIQMYFFFKKKICSLIKIRNEEKLFISFFKEILLVFKRFITVQKFYGKPFCGNIQVV